MFCDVAQSVSAQLLSCVWLFETLWTVACQTPLSMGVFQARILQWDLFDPGINLCLLYWKADSLLLSNQGWSPSIIWTVCECTGRFATAWRNCLSLWGRRYGRNVYPQAQLLGRVWLFSTSRTVAHQAPLSMGFSRQEYCSGLPFSSPWQVYLDKILKYKFSHQGLGNSEGHL